MMLAHYGADVQEDPQVELAWDLEALDAAGQVSDARAKELDPKLTIDGFFPSLHLNLADTYRRLGEPVQARHHLDAAVERSPSLPMDGYGETVRGAIDRLRVRLDEEDAARRGVPDQ